MGKTFKVEFRRDCKICGEPVPKGSRSYCSKKCRTKEYSQRYKEQNREWQRNWWGRAPEVEGTKIQCPICNKWYVQLGSHVVQTHKYENARQFREDEGLDVKRGTVPEWYRELKGEQAIGNGTWENLKNGKKYWFVRGDERAGRYKRSKQTLKRLHELHKKKGGGTTL